MIKINGTQNRYKTVKEVAKILNVTPRRVRAMITAERFGPWPNGIKFAGVYGILTTAIKKVKNRKKNKEKVNNGEKRSEYSF